MQKFLIAGTFILFFVLTSLVHATEPDEPVLEVGDSGPAVLLLQKILNAILDTPVATTGPGSPGLETSYYGAATEAAVMRFQTLHAEEMLTPYGFAVASGSVKPSMISVLAKQSFASSLSLPTAMPLAQLAGTTQVFNRPWYQQKKGLGTWTSNFYKNSPRDSASLKKINLIKPYWYYTWELIPVPGVDSRIMHVPMVWQSPGYRTNTGPCRLENYYPTTKSMMDTLRAQVSSSGKKHSLVLLQNEPDHPSNCMTVDQGVLYAVNHQSGLAEVSNAVISPAGTQPADLKTGKIPWLDAYLLDSKLPKKMISRIAYHHYPDPVALGFIPANANPNNPNDTFYSNKANVKMAAEKLATDFLNRLHMAHRQYGLPIWVTEFNIYDWGAKIDCKQFPEHLCRANDNDKRPTTRISEEVVLEFLKIVLPEMDKRSYIQRYALFAPSLNSKEAERSKAGSVFIVDVKNNVSLTKVGLLYAQHQYNSTCVGGEFKHDGKFVEWVDVSCGKPGNEWSLRTKENRYERIQPANLNAPSYFLR